MGLRALQIAGLLLSVACYDGKLVQGLELTCNGSTRRLCPAGHTCSAIGRCSSDESLFTKVSVSPNRINDNDAGVTVSFTADGLDTVPTVTVADPNGRTVGVMTPGAGTPPDYTFTWVASADGGYEGPAHVLADVTRAGAVSLAHPVSDDLVLDFSPPRVSSQIRLIPHPTNPLLTVVSEGFDELRLDTKLNAFVAADEELRPGGTLKLLPCAGGAASLTLTVDAGGIAFSFEGAFDPGAMPPPGCHVAELAFEDLAGNSTTTDAGSLVIDTTPPKPPNLDPGRIVYRRLPTQNGWRLSVRVDGGVADGERLLVTTPNSPATILSDAADSTGSIAEVVLAAAAPEDVRVVGVAAVDRAGNVSSPPVRVRDVEWVGIGGRSPELTLLERPADTDAPRQGNEDPQRAPDGMPVRVSPRPSWRLIYSDRQVFTAPGVQLAAAACDEDRGECLLFGGRDINGLVEQTTWRWNGSSWAELKFPTGSPQPTARWGAAMAFDSHRRVYVLVGGKSDLGELFDVWQFEKGQWKELTVRFDHPVSRHAMTYDLARRRVQLTGGALAPQGGTVMWEFDGETWFDGGRGPPPARFEHSMVYDRAGRQTLIFGGESTPGALSLYRSDTGWDAGNPAPVDGGTATAAVYDPFTQQLLIFRHDRCLAYSPQSGWTPSGWSCAQIQLQQNSWATAFVDTDGIVVHQLVGQDRTATLLFPRDAGAGGLPRALAGQHINPAPRWRHTFTAVDGGVRLVGGISEGRTLTESSGLLTDVGWSRDPRDQLPYGLEQHAAVATNQRLLVLGGNDGGTATPGSALSFTAGIGWELASPLPFFVEGHVAGVHTTGVILFGGGRELPNGFTPQAGTWRLSGGSWLEIDGGSSPSSRFEAQMVSLPNGRLLMSGGMDVGGGPLGESWVFSDQWQLESVAGELQRYAHAMAVDEQGRVVVFGGRGRLNSFDDTLQRTAVGVWSALQLADPEGDGVPLRRYDHAMATRPGGGVVLFGGGLSAREVYNDSWELDRHSAAVLFRLSLEEVGLRGGELAELTELRFSVVAGAGDGGATASLWHDGRFEPRASDPQASLDSMAPLGFELRASDAALLQRLVLRAEVNVVIRPSGQSPLRAEVGVRSAQVQLRYRLPAAELQP